MTEEELDDYIYQYGGKRAREERAWREARLQAMACRGQFTRSAASRSNPRRPWRRLPRSAAGGTHPGRGCSEPAVCECEVKWRLRV